MGCYLRKKLIGVMLCVFVASFLISAILFAVNLECGKSVDSALFSEKLVLNLGENIPTKTVAFDDGTESGRGHEVGVMLQYSETFSCGHLEINSEKELEEHRKELRAYYEKRNENIIENLNLSDYIDNAYSFYGPFIEYRYETADDFFKNDFSLVKAADCATLEKVYVEEHDLKDDASRNTGRNAYNFTDALADIGIAGKEFTGKGIKIGIVESGVPDNTVNLNGVTYETLGSTLTSHSFHTSSIIGANSGIANDAELYFAALENNTFLACGNWFIEKGVTLINRSNGGATGTYNSYSAYADYLVRENKVTFVNSAGNEGDKNTIGYPSTGLNVISVASNDWNKAISSFSSAGMQPGETVSLAKPTLTAPGGSLSGIKNISGSISGTSFSAPMVTGVVALLMEEFPELKYQPEKVMALLTASCTPAAGQFDVWDHDAGFGIINYQLARENYKNTARFNTANDVSSADTVIYETAVSVPFGATIKPRVEVLANSKQTNTGSLQSIEYSDIKIDVVHSETGELLVHGDTISNLAFVEFTNETYIDENWTTDFLLRVYLGSEKAFTESEDCALSYRIEEPYEPFGLIFSDGRYWQDGDAVEDDFYYEVFASGYEIDAVYVYAPDGEDYVPYQNKSLISVGSCAGDYTFYFEYNGGEISYDFTVCLNYVDFELFRNGESVYEGTVYGSVPQSDSGQYFKWGETIKITASTTEDICLLSLNEDILISREEYEQGEFEITFSFYNGNELSVIIHITHETPKLIIDGKSYGDGESLKINADYALQWFAYDENAGAYIKVTADGLEKRYDLPVEIPEILLVAGDGEVKVYTVEICDEFGDTATLSLTIDKIPPQGFVISGEKAVEQDEVIFGEVIINIAEESVTIEVFRNNELIDYNVGDALTDAGNYEVRLTDEAGNKTTYRFVIGDISENGATPVWIPIFLVVFILIIGGITAVAIVVYKKKKRK